MVFIPIIDKQWEEQSNEELNTNNILRRNIYEAKTDGLGGYDHLVDNYIYIKMH